MSIAFDTALREQLVRRLGEFGRAPALAARSSLKHAAVAITLIEDEGDAAFVITRRAPRLNSHAGQWALPGGRIDAGESATDAALRELQEEVGLRLGHTDVLGVLDDYPTRSGYLITPVVCWACAGTRPTANPDEVASIHLIPVAQIARDDAVEFVRIPESPRPVIRLRIQERWVHAPTAAVLYQFREVLAGRNTRVDELEQPVFAWR